MKIVRIIARLNVGGPARHVILLNAGLRERGLATRLVYGAIDAGEASMEAPAIESGIPLTRIDDLGRSVRAGSDLRAFVALLRLIFRERPDVVHTHTAKAGTLGRLAAFIYNATQRRSRRALVVHTFHGHIFESYFSSVANWMVRATERILAHMSDVIITLSPLQRRDIVERFAVAQESRTVVVPLGVDLESLLGLPVDAPGMRDILGLQDDDVVVGNVGRIVAVKDLLTLIRAFAKANEVVPSLRLVLAGDGPDRARAEALTRELQVSDRVRFLGWVNDLPAFYATIDVFALSSVNEGTPVAVIEAMAASRAVVATAVGGVPDVVESGVMGLLVPALDPDALSQALVALASDAGLRSRMGTAGRDRARAHYSVQRLVDNIERLYVQGLAAKRT